MCKVTARDQELLPFLVFDVSHGHLIFIISLGASHGRRTEFPFVSRRELRKCEKIDPSLETQLTNSSLEASSLEVVFLVSTLSLGYRENHKKPIDTMKHSSLIEIKK